MVDYSAEQHFSRTFCMVNEDLTTNGSWSQRSLSRSMQRAESLLRSTFNPSLRWLFPGRSQDEEETEGHFVVAHNLVSRSSARLLHLQQALLTVAPQWQPVSWALSGSPQVCVKGVPAEVGVLLRASSSSSILQEHYTALWRLLEQRSLLLFIHEYARRARLAAAYVSRVSHLLEESHRTPHQTPSGWSSSSICLGSLSQELRVHLSHWSCLFSKVRSDRYLRPALVQHSRLLGEVKQTLDLLGLQALVLMERYVINSADSVCWIGHSKVRNVAGPQQECAEPKLPTRSKAAVRSEYGRDAKEETGGAEGTAVEPDSLRWPTSVQWMDLGQSLLFVDLFGQYCSLLWTLCSKALWLQLHAPHAGNCAGSINLQNKQRGFQILHRMSQASKTDLVPEEWRTMLDDICLHLLVFTAHAQWDYEVCRSLGSALKDKCLSPVSQSSNSASEQDANVMMSLTMEHLLLLSPPLLTSLSFLQSGSSLSTSTLTLQRITVSLVLATVQLSRVWVMSKAHQFLSSWSLNKFLLITQGDLKGLRRSIDMMVHQTKPLKMNLERKQPSTLHNHNQILLMQQLVALDRTVSELQTFSSLVLKTFSRDCKRMSGEIFEQTMPSAVHWRPSLRTGFPSCPSEYASLAAQTVIGQVLEGVAPLSEDARIQALSITMTAFMEAWMEHILKQRIKFSVQGALQLKQDFDSIRELIQSDKYGLSAELHQRLLSLRVFQQVDSAVVCLLQQPHARPYVQSRAWEPFTRCCPTKSNRDSLDAAVGSSITNLRCVEGEDLTLSGPTVVTDTIPAVNPSNPGEPYLASSVALGVAQQEWLDLRIQSSSRRWRLPGLQCLSKSEP
ncbi:coiled-coil domain-containing protein 142 isoform 3-T5 [Spinachia spinachia]